MGDHRPFFPHWLDEPPVEAVNQAIPLLRSLEAVDAAGG